MPRKYRYDRTHIYFARKKQDKRLIKIGYTDYLRGRMSALGSLPLLVVSVPTDYKLMMERELHDRFSELRWQGEWFYAKEPLLGFIVQVRTTRSWPYHVGRVELT